jgi:DNA-binding transcriptional regulator/RsmH inhibitor MraZ
MFTREKNLFERSFEQSIRHRRSGHKRPYWLHWLHSDHGRQRELDVHQRVVVPDQLQRNAPRDRS